MTFSIVIILSHGLVITVETPTQADPLNAGTPAPPPPPKRKEKVSHEIVKAAGPPEAS